MIWLANLPDLGSHLEKWGMLDRRKVLHDKFKGLLANVIQSGDFGKLVSIDSRLIRFSYPKLWGRTNDPDFDLFVVDSMLVADRGDVAQSLLVEKYLLCIDSLGWQMSSRKNALQFSKCSLRMWLSFISKSIMSLSAVYREFRIQALPGRLVKVNLL